MAIPRHGLHGATCAVIGNMVHVPGGGPVPGGQVQGAYHDAFSPLAKKKTAARRAAVL